MVEKVFISPNRVRAYGNIVNMKTGDDFTLVNSELTVTTDMVDGAEMTVFQFEVEGGISIALTSSSSTCNVGDNVLLTATVMDRSTPVKAAEVTFKLGDTTLGTDETDANGVATYTYATSSAGSLSFSATYQDSTSNSVSVTVNHSYSLAFSQATYTASGGSATLECTLLVDGVALSGASVTVTGSDGSVYNGITNSQGIASVTVSNVSTATTFTATYSNVSDTCTVTVQTYLFYDGGVTGNYNTNYTKSDSGVNVTVGTTGTRISCSTYADCYYRANVVLSGDFEIQYNLVQKTNDSGGFALLDNSTSSVIAYIEFGDSTKVHIKTTSVTTYTYTNYTSKSIVKVTRVGSTLTLYLDDVLIGSKPVSTVDCVFGWKTHSAGGRNFTFKELKIAGAL